MNLLVQEFWKSVSIWRSYRQKSSVLFFFGSQYITMWIFHINNEIISSQLNIRTLQMAVLNLVNFKTTFLTL